MATKQLISIVDDDPSILRMLARTLSTTGFEVALFSSAEELLDSGRLGKSLCLIVDVDLPGMSGLQLQHALKHAGNGVPIIFISGKPTENTRERGLKEGAVAFFDKPFDIDSLLSAVRSVEPLTVS